MGAGLNHQALLLFFCILSTLLCIISCNKADPFPPIDTDENYTVVVDNQYSGLGSSEAAWLSDENGVVRAFRWINGRDSVHLLVPDADKNAIFDVTLMRLTNVAGQGTNDSTFSIKSYQSVGHNKTLTMRKNVLKKSALLSIKFQSIQSLDSIIVPDGLTFQEPNASNNYEGRYLCNHTGQIWFRVLANGNPIWQYAFLNNVSGDMAEILIEDVTILPTLFDPKPRLFRFPFLTYWNYDIQAATDLSAEKFLGIGDIIRAPGGALPVQNEVLVYEPPIGIAPDGYRVNAFGTGSTYTYYIDRHYGSFPDSLPALDFSIEATAVTGPRTAAAYCSSGSDVLVFSRNYQQGLVTVQWDAWLNSGTNAVQTYRLSDIPQELSDLFPYLANYPFQGPVKARVEQYEKLTGYDAVLEKLFANDDPLWQMKAGYLGMEIEF